MKKIIAAGGLVLNDEKQLLMIFRRGKWDLPKGKLDDDEKVEDCAVREVKEETGLQKIDLKDLTGLTYHEYFDTHSNEDVIKETHWFKMHAPGHQQLVPQLEEHIEKIEWVNDKNIGEKLNNSYKNIIEIIGKFKSSL